MTTPLDVRGIVIRFLFALLALAFVVGAALGLITVTVNYLMRTP